MEAGAEEYVDEGIPEEGYIEDQFYQEEEQGQSCAGSMAGMFFGFLIFCIAFWPAKTAFADGGGTWPAILSIVLFWTSFNLMGGPLMFLISYIPVVGQGLRAAIGTINLVLAFIWVMILKMLIQYWLWIAIFAALIVVILIVLRIARSVGEEEYEEEYIEEDAEDAEYADEEYEEGYDGDEEELIEVGEADEENYIEPEQEGY